MLNLVMGSLQLRGTSENIIEFSLYEEDYVFEQVVPGVFRRACQGCRLPPLTIFCCPGIIHFMGGCTCMVAAVL